MNKINKLFVSLALIVSIYMVLSFVVNIPSNTKSNVRYYNECYVNCVILEDYIKERLHSEGVNSSAIECYNYWKEERDSVYFLISK